MRNLLTSAIAWPNFIAYDIKALPALAPLIARIVFGLPLLTWTVRTPEQRERALRYADAMIFEGIEALAMGDIEQPPTIASGASPGEPVLLRVGLAHRRRAGRRLGRLRRVP